MTPEDAAMQISRYIAAVLDQTEDKLKVIGILQGTVLPQLTEAINDYYRKINA